MLWVLMGALGIYITESLGLSPSQKGLMVAIPILSGSLLRVPLGLLSDRIGSKRVGVGMLLFLFLPLTLGWQAGNDLSSLLAVGLMFGNGGRIVCRRAAARQSLVSRRSAGTRNGHRRRGQ